MNLGQVQAEAGILDTVVTLSVVTNPLTTARPTRLIQCSYRAKDVTAAPSRFIIQMCFNVDKS